jgi:hypothetical protein
MAAGNLEEADYPCPACGATLYGWTAARDPLDRDRRIVIDRCETCGLAVTRGAEAPDVDLELAGILKRLDAGELELSVPNRRSIQAGLGGAQWAGLELELRRLHQTPESLRLLLAKRGYGLESVATPYSKAARRTMWQTMVNAFTLRDNFIRDARAGLVPRGTGRNRWAYRLDWLVTVLVAAPVTLAAVPLEAIAAVLGRGGLIEARARRASA